MRLEDLLSFSIFANMKKIVFLVILSLLLLPSCGMRRARAVMDDVETYMQQAPDSAQRALLSLPRRSHYLPWQHARYCLLMSSALDRIGINVQDDSLARYAAEYYDHFGGPVKRFYAQYYLGRVHENRGDRQSAMDAFVKAESITSDRVPARFRCALEMHIGAIYAQIYESDRALEANALAADYARREDLWSAYGESMLRNARIYTMYGRLADADSCLNGFESIKKEGNDWLWLSKMGLDSKRMLAEGASSKTIAHFNDSIISEHKETPSLIPWEDFTKTYVRSGNVEKALYSIKEYERYHDRKENSIYYGLLSEVLDSLGDYRGSLDAYKQYIEISDSLDLIIFNQDTKFLKERYALQEQASRRKVQTGATIIVSILVIGALLLFIIRRRKENTRLKAMYADLRDEYKALQGFPVRLETVSQEASALLGDRIKALSAFFNKGLPASLSLISTQLETLTENRKELLETIGLLFAVYRPDFVLKLTEKGMTPAETGYCCLIALGMRTAEISKVINREGLFNISSALRRKLNLPINSTKLGSVLKQMYGNSASQ